MLSDSPTNCLVVMARVPQAGQVKTRLMPVLGRVGAMHLYTGLLTDTLDRLSQSVQYDRYLSCAPDVRHALFHRYHRHGRWKLQQQPSGDLGMRMTRIFSPLLRRYKAVLVVGSDLVNLGSDEVEWGCKALAAGADLVIGSTLDGGYGMIGMKRLHAGLFRGMPWSTPRVADITLARARRLKLQVSHLHGLQDIDTPMDYYHWRSGRLRENTGSRILIP